MSYLSLQEIFDKVYAHLLTQGKRSYQKNPKYPPCNTGEGICNYRGIDSTKCAVGCLIADEHYTPDMEGIAMPGGRWGLRSYADKENKEKLLQNALELSGIPSDETTLLLLCALQYVHDRKNPERWGIELSLIAKNYNLNIPAEP